MKQLLKANCPFNFSTFHGNKNICINNNQINNEQQYATNYPLGF